MVISLDASLGRYAQRTSSQDPGTEEIQGMAALVAELLQDHVAHTGAWPRALLYYRDGVSEGQFEAVREAEYRAIQRVGACWRHASGCWVAQQGAP